MAPVSKADVINYAVGEIAPKQPQTSANETVARAEVSRKVMSARPCPLQFAVLARRGVGFWHNRTAHEHTIWLVANPVGRLGNRKRSENAPRP